MLKMNKKLTTLAICGALSVSSAIMAFAANDASYFYRDVYEGTKIVIGKDMPDGYYCLYNTKDTKNASYSVKSGSYVLISDSFKYNAIVYVEDDDILNLTNCYAVPLDLARINPVEECMVLVGEHVPAGKYKLDFVRGSSNTATCTVYETLDFHDEEDEDDTTVEDKSDVTKISNGSNTTIEVENGQYLKLSGCRLVTITDD